jgi:hypothetical protein
MEKEELKNRILVKSLYNTPEARIKFKKRVFLAPTVSPGYKSLLSQPTPLLHPLKPS